MNPVDPELRGFLEVMPKFDVSAESLPAIRQMAADMTQLGDLPDGVERSEIWLDRGEESPALRMLVYRNLSAPSKAPVILFFHGGGLVLNSPEFSDARLSHWANELGVTIVAPAYRLAPEHPYPAALDDGLDALSWIKSADGPQGIDPCRIAVAGESAGGCIAASLALAQRDAGRDPVQFLALLYPMLDDRTRIRPDDTVVEAMWTEKSNIYSWAAYLAGVEDLTGAVPGRRTDLSGLPPTWIGVGQLDLFLKENRRFAEALQGAGVVCQLVEYEGAFHGFPAVAEAEVSKLLERDYANCLRAALFD